MPSLVNQTTTTEIQLSKDQQEAHDAVIAWWKNGGPLKTLGGYAGVGKTTTVARIATTMKATRKKTRIGFCAFTGKAASVLGSKLRNANAQGLDDYCGTIHALIYTVILDSNKRIKGWRLKDRNELEIDCFIVDEASMLDDRLFKDLQSYGLPILAVGDHGQLPPVQGALNLMANPEIRLEKIHRQAADNPIIKLSLMVREEGHVPFGDYGPGVMKIRDDQPRPVLERIPDVNDVMFICGTNRTRIELNAAIRARLGFDKPEPMAGERVICLRNNRGAGIFNGMGGRLTAIGEAGKDHYTAEIAMDGREQAFEGTICRSQFGALKTIEEVPGLMPFDVGDRFDWGYALTAHKAQGSEAKRVVVYEECSWLKDEDLRRRWLYTAMTRASEKLIIVGR